MKCTTHYQPHPFLSNHKKITQGLPVAVLHKTTLTSHVLFPGPTHAPAMPANQQPLITIPLHNVYTLYIVYIRLLP